MDIRLFFAVLRRFKKVVIGGFLLAIVLAVLSYGTPGMVHGKPGIVPRGTETWQSQAELMITQGSDPYGRAAEQYTGGSTKTGAPAVPVGDQTYMASLAPIYAAVANGDAIRSKIMKGHSVAGSYTATEVVDTATNAALPFVQLTAIASSSSAAVSLAQDAASVLQAYVAKQQKQAGIAPTDRVVLQLIQNGAAASLVKGHSKSLPLLVFVAVLGAALALAFVRENADPKTAARLGRGPRRPALPDEDLRLPAVPGVPAVAAMSAPAAAEPMVDPMPAPATPSAWLDEVESAHELPKMTVPAADGNGHAAARATTGSSLLKARRWYNRSQSDAAH
jgi:hypothetical protein